MRLFMLLYEVVNGLDLSVAHINVPERAALLLVPYPHGRDAAVGSVVVHAIPDVALGVGRVGTCRDGAVIAGNRRAVELQADALGVAFGIRHPIIDVELSACCSRSGGCPRGGSGKNSCRSGGSPCGGLFCRGFRGEARGNEPRRGGLCGGDRRRAPGCCCGLHGGHGRSGASGSRSSTSCRASCGRSGGFGLRGGSGRFWLSGSGRFLPRGSRCFRLRCSRDLLCGRSSRFWLSGSGRFLPRGSGRLRGSRKYTIHNLRVRARSTKNK